MSRRKVMTGDDGTEYHLGEPIGHGAFSTVYYCRAAVTNVECAVKVYNRAALRSDPVQSRVFDNEVEALRSIPQSPAIANKIAIYNSSRNCYILLEYCKGGNLFNRIVKSGIDGLSDGLVRRWFQQLVAGLRDVHRAGFAHRDIKPENLLIDAANDLKVSDFGFATRCSETTVLEEDCGTARYVAPEVLQRSYNGLLADIWSVGVTLFVMLTGRLPFVATRQEDLYRKIAAGVLPPLPATVCQAAEHLLRSCLQVDPSKRMSLRRLANHPYCRGYETMNVRLSRPVGGAGTAGDATTSGATESDPTTTLVVAAPSASYTSLRDRTMRSLPQGEVAAWRTHEGRTRELQRMNLPPPPTPVDRKVVRTLSGGASEALLPPSSARSPAVEAQTPLDRASALDGRCSSSKSPHPISPRPQRSPAGTPAGARGTRETPVSPATSGSTAATLMGETPSILRRLGFVHARMVLRFALVVAQLLIAGIARLLFNVRLERQVDFPRPVQRLLERFFEPPASEAPDERGPNGWKLGATTPRHHVSSTPIAMSPQRQAVSPQSDNSALKKQSHYN